MEFACYVVICCYVPRHSEFELEVSSCRIHAFQLWAREVEVMEPIQMEAEVLGSLAVPILVHIIDVSNVQPCGPEGRGVSPNIYCRHDDTFLKRATKWWVG